jgi:hypothetical protein
MLFMKPFPYSNFYQRGSVGDPAAPIPSLRFSSRAGSKCTVAVKTCAANHRVAIAIASKASHFPYTWLKMVAASFLNVRNCVGVDHTTSFLIVSPAIWACLLEALDFYAVSSPRKGQPQGARGAGVCIGKQHSLSHAGYAPLRTIIPRTVVVSTFATLGQLAI